MDTAITGHTFSRGGATAPPSRFRKLRGLGLANLLVTGGSRAERERVAREFHSASRLRRGPFVAASAAAASWAETLLRTISGGPARESADLLHQAEGGTLFIDDVDGLSPDLQRLMLEFLWRGRSESADDGRWAGRIVAGCGKDLNSLIATGRFLAPLHDTLDKLRVDLAPQP